MRKKLDTRFPAVRFIRDRVTGLNSCMLMIPVCMRARMHGMCVCLCCACGLFEFLMARLRCLWFPFLFSFQKKVCPWFYWIGVCSEIVVCVDVFLITWLWFVRHIHQDISVFAWWICCRSNQSIFRKILECLGFFFLLSAFSWYVFGMDQVGLGGFLI